MHMCMCICVWFLCACVYMCENSENMYTLDNVCAGLSISCVPWGVCVCVCVCVCAGLSMHPYQPL